VLNRNGSKYVGVPDTDSLDISGDNTIAAWATSQAVITMYLVKKAMQGTVVVGQELGMAAGSGTTCTPATNPCPFGRFRYATGDGDAYRINGSGNYTATDSWTHNAVTKSGTTLLICKNGVQIGTRKVATITIGTNTLVLGFGPQIDGSGTASSFFTGSLDVNRIYRRALYVNEIPILVDQEPQAATTTSLSWIFTTCTPTAVTVTSFDATSARAWIHRIIRIGIVDQLNKQAERLFKALQEFGV